MLVYSVTRLRRGRRTGCATKVEVADGEFHAPPATEPNIITNVCQRHHPFVGPVTKIRRTCEFVIAG